MKTTYQISETDYVHAYVLSLRLSAWTQVVIGLISMVVVAAMWLFSLALSLVIYFVCVMAVAMLVKFVFSPWIAQRYYRRHRAIWEPYCVEMLSDRLIISSTRGCSHLLWHQIYSWRHDEHVVIIYPKPRYFYILPKSISNQGFDISQLLSELRLQNIPLK